MKLKRKIQFRGHVYFEAVRPEFVMTALNWLKAYNILYKDIQIDCTNISTELTSIMNDEEIDHTNSLLINSPQNNLEKNTYENTVNSANSDNSVNVGVNSLANNTPSNNMEVQNEEEVEDSLNEHRSPANKTCLQSVIPDYPLVTEEHNSNNSTGREIYNIAPGENKHPVSLMTDKQWEELAFPVLFPNGKFGYTAERDVTLSLVKYFNARQLHYGGWFATNPEYLFFAQFIIEQKKVSDSINIALKKVYGHSVTASQVRSNTQILQNLISKI